MFGYVIPNQKKMSEDQLQEYKAWYCGLCRILKKRYGFFGQISLTYDMTFLGLLLTSLYEPEVVRGQCHCIVHPLEKRAICTSRYLEYAADMNILLSYYKCKDDWQDEHKLVRAGYGAILHQKGKSFLEKYWEKAEYIQKCLRELSEAELRGSRNLDEVAGMFGNVCGCLFVYQEDQWTKTLWQTGFFLGKFIYLMDAWEDMEKDRKHKNYNPLIPLWDDMKLETATQTLWQPEDEKAAQTIPQPEKGEIAHTMPQPEKGGGESVLEQQFQQKIQQILTMMLAEASRAFERLPILENVEILRNILYSGVWCRYNQMLEKKIEKGKDVQT